MHLSLWCEKLSTTSKVNNQVELHIINIIAAMRTNVASAVPFTSVAVLYP